MFISIVRLLQSLANDLGDLLSVLAIVFLSAAKSIELIEFTNWSSNWFTNRFNGFRNGCNWQNTLQDSKI